MLFFRILLRCRRGACAGLLRAAETLFIADALLLKPALGFVQFLLQLGKTCLLLLVRDLWIKKLGFQVFLLGGAQGAFTLKLLAQTLDLAFGFVITRGRTL